MIKKMMIMATLVAAGVSFASAQDSTSTPLQISGSVDAYYKYDFSGYKPGNITTSFASDNNSVSLGMIDVALKKSTGKASFVGEISFGPRGQWQSIPNGDANTSNADNSFHIQNLYATYAFTDKFSMTAGYMGTFVGYEVISPVGNVNYSTSYLFTNGPFQNAGIKGTYAFSSKASLMVGLFNDWNTYRDFNGVSHVGAQLFLSPVEGWSAYLNALSGYSAGAQGTGTILDLTTAYQISKGFKLGLNAADYSVDNDGGGYSGIALYPQVAITDGFGLGLRGEYFKWKERTDVSGATPAVIPETSVTALTLSANLKAGGLTVIPEIRFDNGKDDMFFKGENSTIVDTKSASQFTIGVVYAF
jgi:hypothetical protein